MSAPVRSMTGFARAQRSLDPGEISISLKSVNHKGLDLHFHLEPKLAAFEGVMRAALKKAILRGHVDIHCAVVQSNGEVASGVNLSLLKASIAAFRKAAREEGLDVQPDLNQLLRLPGVFGAADMEEPPDPAIEGPLLDLLGVTIDALNQFRSREGSELVDFIRRHNRDIAQRASEIAEIRARALPAFQSRLTEKLAELLGNTAVDPQRIVQEAAILTDRSDIGEETSRLEIHSRQLEEILAAGGEVGKKIDFLLQEMNRETNTILSKTSGIGDLGLRITDLALAVKAGIEKIREQALNLE